MNNKQLTIQLVLHDTLYHKYTIQDCCLLYLYCKNTSILDFWLQFVQIICVIMNHIIYVTLALLLTAAYTQTEIDEGTLRLNQLRERTSNSNSSIIIFTAQDFDKYAMKYPRPYDLVIYFYAKQVPLCEQLYPQFNYTVQLYKLQGAIDAQINPTFFVRIDYSQSTHKIFKMFNFQAAPNLVVSKPYMAVVSDVERESYLKEYKWWISHTDGVVTTQKILDFINKRTKKNIIYKPTDETIEYVLKIFLGVCLGGVVVYKSFKFIWNHWFFWYLMSIIAYMVCMSGIVYCIINGSIQQDIKRSGRIQFFSGGGSRQQTFYEGCLVSGVVTLTGIIFVIIAVSGQKIRERYSAIIGILGLVLVYYLISYIQQVYSLKGWYGPSYKPPEHYLRGPLSVDQGNNI